MRKYFLHRFLEFTIFHIYHRIYIENKLEDCYNISIPKQRKGCTDMRKDIRTKIVDTLNERQLNRKNLAEYTGISQSTITKILGRFIENPSKATLVTMCEKLNLTYSPAEIGRFEYTAASFTQEELAAFNDALETKLREGKSAEEIIKAIQEL